jgi:dolichyl-phosphate-mannose--protein O-mannosyl transferase
MLLAIFSGIGWLIVGLVYDHLFKKPFKCLNPYPELIVISFVVMVLLPPLSPITNWTQVLWMFVGTALTVKTFDYLNWKQPTE